MHRFHKKIIIETLILLILYCPVQNYGAPPSSGIFNAVEVRVDNEAVKDIIHKIIETAKEKKLQPPAYNIYCSYGPITNNVPNFMLTICIEPTNGIPWYKWESYCIFDSYLCFMNNYFTDYFTSKNNNKTKTFDYSFEGNRQNEGVVYEWLYKFSSRVSGIYKIKQYNEKAVKASSQQSYMQQYDFIKSLGL